MATTITASVKLPVALRSKLEHVRLARAERSSRVPRLRDLILEAVLLFLEREASAATPAVGAVR
jgi:hypothetical protein